MLARQGQVHQSQYVETLNPLNPNYVRGISGLAHQLVANGLSQADATRAATAQIYQSLQQQAAMLSYIDVFHVLMWIVFAVTPLVLLLKKPGKLQDGGGAAP
jgi:DHA2 family multidrug resistance protein